MQRPFAVIGFSIFFTAAVLFKCETGVIRAALIGSAVALVVALFLGKVRRIKEIPVSLSSVALACVMLIVTTEYYYVPMTAYNGMHCDVKAVLTDNGQLEYGNYYFGAKTLEINGEKTEIDISLVFEDRPDADAYDLVEGEFLFYLRGKSSDSAMFSNKASGNVLGAYPKKEYIVTEIIEEEKPLAYKFICCRDAVKNAVYKALPDESGSLAVAMLLGDKSDIPSDIYRDIRTVGLAHTVCVSGLHLSLWAGVLMFVLQKMRLNRKVAAVISATGVLAFMALEGFTYSVMRAGIMMLVYLLSEALSRKNDSLNSLGAAITVMACLNPFSIGSISLELSVLSTAGVIINSQFISPKISGFLYRKINNILLFKAVRAVVGNLSATACVSIMTVPLIYNFSASVSLYPLVSNIIILPFVGISMVLCAAGALWASVFGVSGNVFAFAGGSINKMIIAYSDWFSKFDFLNLRMEQESVTLILCGVMLFGIFALLIAFKGNGKPVLSFFLAFAILISSSVTVSYSQRNQTEINVIDTGDGMAVLFSLDGENVLVNCGGDDFFAESRILNAVDTCYGKIDCIVLTDMTEQTSSEAVDVIKEFSPEVLMCGRAERETLRVSSDAVIVDINGRYQSKNFVVRGLEPSCVIVETKDIVVALCSRMLNSAPQADILITLGNYPDQTAEKGYTFVVVCDENSNGVRVQNKLASAGARVAATAGNGNIIIRARKGDISVKRKDG